MLTEMKDLARQKDICVLATVAGQKPYCSLMAYVTDDNCEKIYMVTHRNSTKYQNMLKNPAVSLLIDTREKSPRSQAKALTVEGVFRKIEHTEKRKQVTAKLLQTHPHLDSFMQHPEAEVFCVKISSFLLLNGLQQAHFETV
ncbi:MAG: pyridoxamine 5'-phosphate oxidase family protein [Deltaproteobacteria bacterium]|jgi:nitroimidazol reductase NimA-like FMN-containing flavoprotein (pyridoxamine 5'-phosphate oxidase superfamily)|nr:pyridoxamine 5'-phosphate oxidase family protein [Deltaproteobacteria bacterium]MBW2468681.1 pyridoxamine 5'-phosphate oxidase family protein [Deltaproteobacteria bacterium]